MGLLRTFSCVFFNLVRESEKYGFSRHLDSPCSRLTDIVPGAHFGFTRQCNAGTSSGTSCLHVVEVPTIFLHSDHPHSAHSHYLGKEKLCISKPIQLREKKKKSKRKGEFEPCRKLGDKIDGNVFHSWLFREWTLMTLKYCKSFNIKSVPGHGPAFGRQLILRRIHTTVSSGRGGS